MKICITGVIAALFLLLAIPECFADGLSTLIDVGKSQQAMNKELDKETKSFEAVKRAIETGSIKKGDSGTSIRKKYGEPVVVLADKAYAEKWIYKPGDASFFGGVKICLFFDGEGKLRGIKILSS